MTRSCGEAARYETESKCEAASCRWVRGRQTEAAPTSAGDAASVTETDSGGVAVRDHALPYLGATLRLSKALVSAGPSRGRNRPSRHVQP
jgi:hypothetical protein